MKLYFEEQDVIDAVCVYEASLHSYRPEQIDAIAVYLRDYHNFIPDRLRIELQFEQSTGVTANIIAQ